MNQIIDEFNNTSFMFIDFIDLMVNEKDIKKIRNKMKTAILFNKKRLIDNFVINILPHYNHIVSKNSKYFIDLNCDYEQNILIGIIKAKNIFTNFDDKNKDILFDYLKLLSDFALEYNKNNA